MLQTKTVLKIGNSLGVTFPSDFVNEHKIKQGDKVHIIHKNGVITYSTKSSETKYEDIPDLEFVKLLKEVDTRYSSALRDLANLE